MGWSVELEIVIPRPWLRAGGAGLLLALAPRLGSESVSLTAYYPAATGAYKNLVVADSVYLARDGGFVGVGTASPSVKLQVNGTFNAGGDDITFSNAAHGYGASGAGQASVQNVTDYGGVLLLEGRSVAGIRQVWFGRSPANSADTVDLRGKLATGPLTANRMTATLSGAPVCVAGVQNTSCAGGKYITFLPGMLSKYQGNPYLPAQDPSPPVVFNPFLCCNCPATGCPSM